MKKLILSLVVFATLTACNSAEKQNTNNAEQDTTQQASNNDLKSEKDYAPSTVILGTWTGDMDKGKLTIVIEKINGLELEGYSLLGSDKRNLKGTFTDGDWDQPCTKAYQATLNETGNDDWDGVFTVKFVGYEDEKETEMGPECIGNLKGVEAMGDFKSSKNKSGTNISLVKEK